MNIKELFKKNWFSLSREERIKIASAYLEDEDLEDNAETIVDRGEYKVTLSTVMNWHDFIKKGIEADEAKE